MMSYSKYFHENVVDQEYDQLVLHKLSTDQLAMLDVAYAGHYRRQVRI